MHSSGALHVCRPGRLRTPSSLDDTRSGPGVRARAQENRGGLQEPRLRHPRFPATTGGDAVAAVLLEVAMQMVGAHESLKAAGALIGPQAGVHTHVILQVVVVGKGSSTLCTQVRLFSCMLSHVNLELVLSEREKDKQGLTTHGQDI